jgi:hypothetical protein
MGWLEWLAIIVMCIVVLISLVIAGSAVMDWVRAMYSDGVDVSKYQYTEVIAADPSVLVDRLNELGKVQIISIMPSDILEEGTKYTIIWR